MRSKLFYSFFLLVLIYPCCMSAQIDYESSLYLKEVKQVVDTLKAEELANLFRFRKKGEITQTNDSLNKQIEFLNHLIDTKATKLSVEDANFLLCICNGYWHGNEGFTLYETPYSDIREKLEKGKIHRSLLYTLPKLSDEIKKKQISPDKFDKVHFSKIVDPLPSKEVTIYKFVPDIVDDALKFGNYTKKKVSYPNDDEYYVAYALPDYKLRKVGMGIILISDCDDKEIGAAQQTSDKYEEDSRNLLKACMKFDFLHNAYNIENENSALKEYISFCITSGGTISEAIRQTESRIRTAETIFNTIKSAKAKGQMSQSAYDKNYADHLNIKKQYEFELSNLKKAAQTPQIESQVEKYISQLRKDNDKFVRRILTTKRIDAYTYEESLPDENFKVLKKLGYDSFSKEYFWDYTVVTK